MKNRNGFVSNSSSSSFMIALSDLTALQLKLIENHSAEGAKYGIEYPEDSWYIEVDDTHVRGRTFMDNFDMHSFLRAIGVDMSKVSYDRD